ncbi:hypothetical protein JAAARDRAFT_138523, partial [Jaapia argillacea MUCL 33604]
RESFLWHRLKHRNVLPFLGVCYFERLSHCPTLISPYCEFGAVMEYLKRHQANRLTIVRQIGMGLQYLHDNRVVHGDLKTNNVLIDSEGVPLLADFGRSKLVDHHGYTTTLAAAWRYVAGEVMHHEPSTEMGMGTGTGVPNVMLSKKSDVYSFGMTALEVSVSTQTDSLPNSAISDPQRPHALLLPLE